MHPSQKHLAIGLLIFAVSQDASAHLVSTRFGEFYAGLLHPLTSFIHLLPWLCLGLFAGLQKAATARLAILVFPISVLFGALFGAMLSMGKWVDYFNLASLALMGALVVFAFKLTPSLFAFIAAALGLFHGFANGDVALSGQALALYLAGVCVSAYATVTLTAGLSHGLQTSVGWGAIALRAAGSWIFAIGLMFAAYVVLNPETF